MKAWMRNMGATDVAIDLGTAKTAFYVKGEGVVAQTPSMVSLRTSKSGATSVVAFGEKAAQIRGKEPQGIRTVKPLNGGVIEDLPAAKLLLAEIARSVGLRRGLRGMNVLVGAPYSVSDIERRAVVDAARSFGATRVHVVEEPIASAIGAGVAIAESMANMIVDIGSGITEVAVIALGGIVHAESVRLGGDDVSQALVSHFRHHCGLIIGEQTAEDLKANLCDLARGSTMACDVKGTDIPSRMPRTRRVTAESVREAILGPVNGIVDAIQKTFEKTPPMLAGDLVDRGIILTGGGALLRNLGAYVEEVLRLPVIVAEDPYGTVVRGAGKMLGEIATLNRM